MRISILYKQLIVGLCLFSISSFSYRLSANEDANHDKVQQALDMFEKAKKNSNEMVEDFHKEYRIQKRNGNLVTEGAWKGFVAPMQFGGRVFSYLVRSITNEDVGRFDAYAIIGAAASSLIAVPLMIVTVPVGIVYEYMDKDCREEILNKKNNLDFLKTAENMGNFLKTVRKLNISQLSRLLSPLESKIIANNPDGYQDPNYNALAYLKINSSSKEEILYKVAQVLLKDFAMRNVPIDRFNQLTSNIGDSVEERMISLLLVYAVQHGIHEQLRYSEDQDFRALAEDRFIVKPLQSSHQIDR